MSRASGWDGGERPIHEPWPGFLQSAELRGPKSGGACEMRALWSMGRAVYWRPPHMSATSGRREKTGPWAGSLSCVAVENQYLATTGGGGSRLN
jgi:hypothetical protein